MSQTVLSQQPGNKDKIAATTAEGELRKLYKLIDHSDQETMQALRRVVIFLNIIEQFDPSQDAQYVKSAKP